ncbi:MAG: DUF2442 domain-containing protein [Ferruginibacter sp.]
MNTSTNKYDAIENLIFSEGLKIKMLALSPDQSNVYIYLSHDLKLVIPVTFYKGLRNATPNQIKNYILLPSGTGIHWPELDEDLSLKGFLKEYLHQMVKSEKELAIK